VCACVCELTRFNNATWTVYYIINVCVSVCACVCVCATWTVYYITNVCVSVCVCVCVCVCACVCACVCEITRFNSAITWTVFYIIYL